MKLGSRSRGSRIFFFGIISFGLLGPILADQVAARTPLSVPAAISSSDATRRLQAALHRLNATLSGSEHAEAWRRLLWLNILETQSALGEQADVSTLSEINNRFLGNSHVLEHRAFRDVQVAIQQQIQNLSASYVGDLYAAVTMARGQYKPITISEMFYQRDVAMYELQLLQLYYRQTLSSSERAGVFYDIRLDQVMEFLGGIRFELAPEISVGKMDSMIRRVQEQLDETEKAIDALPIIPESDDIGNKPGDGNEDTKQPAQPAQELESELNITPDLFGPEPDEGVQTADELKKKFQKLEEQIAELKKQRSEIAKQDRGRQVERGKTFTQLRKFEETFVEAGKKRGDPYFVSASSTYQRFVRTYYYGTSDNLQEDFLKRLEGLEADLLELDGPNAREAAGQVGDACRWMENANQVPHLVTAIRARYSQPNVYVGVSSQVINQLGSQPVAESRYVRENVMGRLVRGTARTNGRVSIDFQNDPNQVHASIRLSGSVDSQTYVEQGKLRIFADGRGQLAGQRSIYANIGGMFAGAPYVSAKIQTSLRGTSSRLRLVNRIAAKKFEEARGAGEATTSRKAEQELLWKFSEQTDKPIREGQAALLKAQDRLVANSHLVPEIYIRSFTNQVMAVGKKSTISTLAAQSFPTRIALRTDVAVRVHDSLLSNFLDTTFSGKTFTDEELSQEIGELVGQAPESLANPAENANQEDESFSITFATIRPIQFEFEDNGFRVVVSGRRFSQGDKQINEGMKISLRFRIKRIDGKLKLVRDGKALLEYLDDDYPAKAVAFRSFLDGKLNPKEGGKQISVDLPDNLLPVDKVEVLENSEIAKRLRLVQCRSENGWLYLGWNYLADYSYPNWFYDVPAILNETTINQMEPTYLYESNPGELQLNSVTN